MEDSDSSKAKTEQDAEQLTKKKISCGIDLGTTNSVIGIYEKGSVVILQNELGNTTTPSYVGFTDEERLVVAKAVEQVVDEKNKKSMKRPIIQVTYKGEQQEFTAEEISAML
ncbi:heat shock protein 70 [Aphelenchoides avenae]|nr:heat shock protein 70 [Aphelenchus avenae]